MKVTAECIPCYLNQCLNAMDKGGMPKERQEEVLIKLLPVIASLDISFTPAENSTIILHELVRLMGNQDPFAKAKKESNQQALLYIDDLRERINKAKDPLRQAVKFSVAGNVVDLGLFDNYDLKKAISDVIETEFKRDSYLEFRDMAATAKSVLIVGDNSGEIVFDTLLVEVLLAMKLNVTYAVKGSFVLNDATMEDVVEAGMDKLCKNITNGNNYLGTIEQFCSAEFLAAYRTNDLIISKGQANYESLEGTKLANQNTFFLLKAKCPVVAAHLGVNYGDIVFARNTL